MHTYIQIHTHIHFVCIAIVLQTPNINIACARLETCMPQRLQKLHMRRISFQGIRHDTESSSVPRVLDCVQEVQMRRRQKTAGARQRGCQLRTCRKCCQCRQICQKGCQSLAAAQHVFMLQRANWQKPQERAKCAFTARWQYPALPSIRKMSVSSMSVSSGSGGTAKKGKKHKAGSQMR